MHGTKTFLFADEGATAVEYALLAALLVVIVIAAFSTLTGPLGGLFSYASSALLHGASGL
jgi:Flp pilus assembly pilin Flp